MLYSIATDAYVERIPHPEDYDRWRGKIANSDYQAIFDALSSRLSVSQIETSSWIPGSDWSDTVFHPIYEHACEFDEVAAARFFGLILWHVVMEHDQVWAFGRYQLGDIPIEGLTYFRIDPPDN